MDLTGLLGGLVPLEGGWSGETFLAETAGDRCVVRIFADPHHAPSAVEVNAALLRLVRGLVPVPAVLEVRRPADGVPGLLITEHVAGERGDLLLPRLSEADLGVVGESLGRVAGTLAGMPQLRAGTFTDGELRVEPFALDLVDWVESHRAALGWAPDDLAGLVDLADHAQDLLDTVGRVSLVHSDLNPKNVLIDPSGLAVTAVVDWEFAHAGSPYADLGNLLRFDRAPAYVEGVLAGFTGLRAGSAQEALELARAADLVALFDLAARRDANPVAAQAHDHLLAIARARDWHAVP